MVTTCRIGAPYFRRSRRVDEAAYLVEFPWSAAKLAYESLRWMALAILLIAGWGLRYRLNHGIALDPVTLGAAVGSAALGLLRPPILRSVMNSWVPPAPRLATSSIPACPARAILRAVEILALAVLASALSVAVRVATSCTRAITARVMVALAVITPTLQPRLAAALAAGSPRSVRRNPRKQQRI